MSGVRSYDCYNALGAWRFRSRVKRRSGGLDVLWRPDVRAVRGSGRRRSLPKAARKGLTFALATLNLHRVYTARASLLAFSLL